MRTPQGCCRLRFTVRLRRSTLSHSAFFITEAPIRIIRQDDKRIWGLLIGVSATRIKMSVDTVEQLLEQGVHLVGVWVWVWVWVRVRVRVRGRTSKEHTGPLPVCPYANGGNPALGRSRPGCRARCAHSGTPTARRGR